MDVPSEMGKIKNVQFVSQGSGDVVRHSPRALRGLDLAEMKLIKGDVDGAATLAQQALAQHTPEPGRADFILARCAVMRRNVEDARKYFEQTIQLSKDPRLLAWSHIYLGRMDDLEHSREEALVQYHAALEARDGQMDTKEAAERGIKAPYGPPPGVQTNEGVQGNEGDDGDEAPPTTPPPPKSPR
jgi:tetratricopeptide (TPR) repeat protein